MKCVNCSEEIIQSITGWRSASKPHRSICDPTDDNSRFHEPEPTEAAPSTEPLVAHIAGVIADALHNTDPLYHEREAIVVDPTKCVTHGVTLESCRKDMRTGCRMGMSEAVVGGQPEKTALQKCVTEGADCDCKGNCKYGVTPEMAKEIIQPHPETPCPEMGKAVIADGIYARVESALQHGVISETWPEIWTAIRPIIEQLEVSLQDDLKYRITPTVILAVASGTESVPVCPKCRSNDNKPFTNAAGVTMRACFNCLLEWREENPQPSSLTPPNALSALRRLYEETADYIRINNLGDVHHNQSMQDARDVLASSLTQAGPPSLTQIKEWIISRGEFTPFDPNGSYVVSGWQLMTMLESWAAQSQKGGGE